MQDFFLFWGWQTSKIRYGKWLHNFVNVLETTKLNTFKGRIVWKFYLKKIWWKIACILGQHSLLWSCQSDLKMKPDLYFISVGKFVQRTKCSTFRCRACSMLEPLELHFWPIVMGDSQPSGKRHLFFHIYFLFCYCSKTAFSSEDVVEGQEKERFILSSPETFQYKEAYPLNNLWWCNGECLVPSPLVTLL